MGGSVGQGLVPLEGLIRPPRALQGLQRSREESAAAAKIAAGQSAPASAESANRGARNRRPNPYCSSL